MARKVMLTIIKALSLVFIVLLLIYCFQTLNHFGYDIFADQAKDSKINAVTSYIFISENESLKDIGQELQEKGIVKDGRVFVLAVRCMDDYKKIKPGNYEVSSSQKPSEILKTIINKEAFKKKNGE